MLKEEIDTIIGDKKEISYEDIMSLEYSSMVIKVRQLVLRAYFYSKWSKLSTNPSYSACNYPQSHTKNVVLTSYSHKRPLVDIC